MYDPVTHAVQLWLRDRGELRFDLIAERLLRKLADLH